MRIARGFTLIEALVALTIMAIVAVLAYRATAAMTDGESRVATESARWRALDATFTRIEADLREAVPRPVRQSGTVQPAWASLSDDAGNTALAFTRAGPEFSAEPGIAGQRIGYRLTSGALQVVYWPQLDNVPTATPSVYTLADGVARFRVLALTSRNLWSERWPIAGEAELPRAVEVEIVLAGGSAITRKLVLQ
jgi:general secretion pathway protein J